jgi:hypothetical protein
MTQLFYGDNLAVLRAMCSAFGKNDMMAYLAMIPSPGNNPAAFTALRIALVVRQIFLNVRRLRIG